MAEDGRQMKAAGLAALSQVQETLQGLVSKVGGAKKRLKKRGSTKRKSRKGGKRKSRKSRKGGKRKSRKSRKGGKRSKRKSKSRR